MNSHPFAFIVTLTSLLFQSATSQSILLAKTIDSSHRSVVAILRVDSSGKAWGTASGVLIHPRVVLTAGHVNMKFIKRNPVSCVAQGLVSIAQDASRSSERVAFDWLQDIETHPEEPDYIKGIYDTTNHYAPYMFTDIGLLFLSQPVDDRPIAHLPKAFALAQVSANDRLVGVGFGYHKTKDSTFKPAFVDGLRRQWRLQTFSLFNDLWLSTQCDSATNAPFIGDNDSGAPLLLADTVVVGVWSTGDDAIKPCLYSSWAVRVDNPKVLGWIRDRVKKRLGVDLE